MHSDEHQNHEPAVALQGSNPFCENAKHFHHHSTNIANFYLIGALFEHRENNMHYTAKLTKEKDGGFSVEFPDIEGCFSEGDSLEEALLMAKDALELTLRDVFDGEPLPASKTKPNHSKGLYSIDVDPELAVALTLAAYRGAKPQSIAAKEMGMQPQAYQRLEDPSANLSVKMLHRIANYIGKKLEISFK
ncbi:MAG: type II toxin-antitoxin system HicB family antitoxin [Fibrobacter sp.]|nr:type II toxin-antitoxin system HicB family antitoxin [Fibrobacter sp.]